MGWFLYDGDQELILKKNENKRSYTPGDRQPFKSISLIPSFTKILLFKSLALQNSIV